MTFYRKLNTVDYSLIRKKHKSLHLFTHQADNFIAESVFNIDFNEIENQDILFANDEFLVFDIEKKSRLMYSLAVLPLLSIFSYLIYLDEPLDPKILFYILSFGLFTAIISIAIYVIFAPKKELIFDRKNGLITFPNIYIQKNITMPFKNVMWDHFTKQGRSARIIKNTEIIIKSPTSIFYGFSFYPFFKRPTNNLTYHSMFFPEETISFLKWYMDKNRPLPPCKIFDSFREKDFLRRKRANFKKAKTKLSFRNKIVTLYKFNETDI